MDIPGQPHDQVTRYYSKKDTWIVALLCAALALPLILMISFLAIPGIPLWVIWEMLFIEGGVVALVVGLTYSTYYEITPSSLMVRSGWIRWVIPLACIQQVFPTRNALSGPAWSLDRLQVDYEKDSRPRFVLISPKDKLSFLQNLAESTEELEIRDDRVVRRQ